MVELVWHNNLNLNLNVNPEIILNHNLNLGLLVRAFVEARENVGDLVEVPVTQELCTDIMSEKEIDCLGSNV